MAGAGPRAIGGNPNGIVVAEKGSLCIDTFTPALWQAIGTSPFYRDWEKVGVQS